MHLFLRYILSLMTFVILLASISCIGDFGTPTTVLSPKEAQQKWEGDRATMEGIAVEEAQLRNSIEGHARVLQNSLRRSESEKFAGLWIQREPEYRIVVALTSGGTNSVAKYIETDSLAQSVEVRTVKYSIVELQNIRQETDEVLSEAGVGRASGISFQDNQIVYYLPNPDEVFAAFDAAGAELPDCVSVVQEDFSEDDVGDNNSILLIVGVAGAILLILSSFAYSVFKRKRDPI